MTYESFISMNMASKNDVDSCIIQQLFHGVSHAFTFPLMSSISIIPRSMQENKYPRSPLPINLSQVSFEPFILSRILVKIGIRSQHYNVSTSNIKRVIQIRRGSALFVGHEPACVVGLEGVGEDDGDRLDLVVTLRHHPRAAAGVGLNQPPEGVPKRLLKICVRQIAW